MRARDDLLEELAALRPPDPMLAEVEPIAVRVLARLAVRESGEHAGTRTLRQRRCVLSGLAAAALVLLLLPFAFQAGRPGRSPPPRRQPFLQGQQPPQGQAGEPRAPSSSAAQASGKREDAWTARIEAALDGNLLQRGRLLRGGPAARQALLRAAAGGGEFGRRSLELLGRAGALRGAQEAARVTALAFDPSLRPPALRLLERGVGRAGARGLGLLLEDLPAAESEVVAALATLAARGQRQAALEGLLLGVRKGRNQAAAQAIRLAGAGDLKRILAALDDEALASAPVAAAVGVAPRTVRARLVRMAEGGDERALDLATIAGVSGIVAVLVRRAGVPPQERARAALERLATFESVEAWLGIARALDGAAAGRASELLGRAPQAVVLGLQQRACASPRDAPAALRALAAAGPAGLEALARFGEQTRYAPAVVRALGLSGGYGSSQLLLELAARPALAPGAIDALGQRLSEGHGEAGAALLSLARRRHDRAVFRVLGRSGAAGRALLVRASTDAQLGRRARESLTRGPARQVEGAGSSVRVARRPPAPRAKRPRSI